MALIATVTKVSVTKLSARGGSGKYNVSLNLKVNDGTNDVINTNLTEYYNSNDDTISNVQEKFQVTMQKIIDDYKLGMVLSDSMPLATAIINLQNSLAV